MARPNAEPVSELAKCAPFPPSRVVAIRGDTIDLILESLTRNAPLWKIIEAGLSTSATTEQRAGARKAAQHIKLLQLEVCRVIAADPLIKISHEGREEELNRQHDKTVAIARKLAARQQR